MSSECRNQDANHPFDFAQGNRALSGPNQRARTTSFFVQVWTWRQCGQLNLLLLIFAAAHNSSLIVWPLGVSLAVEGQRMSKRLITGPFAFGAVGRAKKCINKDWVSRADKRCALYRYRRVTCAV